MDYLEWKIDLKPVEPWSEILMALLADKGFEAFVETETGIEAYVPESLVVSREEIIRDIKEWAKDHQIKAKTVINVLPQQNWNAAWEADFDPVYVDDDLSILAPFHNPTLGKGMVLTIQPHMSFGTGHHQTTYLMCKHLFGFNNFPKRVLDMGTGTGILAILAEKLGARHCLAIDIEEWSVKNAESNAELNHCKHLKCQHGDIELIEGQNFDCILANINKNVLKHHLPHYSKALEKGGTLILSGFFTTDIPELEKVAEEYGLTKLEEKEKENWAAVRFQKN